MPDNRPYAIYLRKSREDREIEKYEGVDTLDRHRKTLLKFAQEHNMQVGHIYEEVVSGETIAERNEMKKLIKDVENRMWKGILVMEVQRLARGETEDQGIVARVFKYSSTEIVTPGKSYNPNNEFDEEYFEFGLFMSRREYKTINGRLKRGRETSVNEGKFVGNIAPLGYERIKLKNSKGYSLKLNLEEADIVRKIFNLFAYENISINKIANKLDMMGLKPRKTLNWSSSTIKDVLNNPVYIGKIRWNARKQEIATKDGKRFKSRPRNQNPLIVDGLHDSIIDEKTWNIVQNKRKLNLPPVPHNKAVKNPLAGIIYCAKCGKPMQRRPYNKKNKPATIMCSNTKCDNISSKLFIVEDKIIQALKIWINNYKIDYEKLLGKNRPTVNITYKEQLKQLKTRLVKEKTKLNKIYDYFEDGTYNKQEFEERLSTQKFKIKEFKDKIKQLEIKLKKEENIDKERTLVFPKIQNALDIYDKLDNNEEKNKLLKSLIKKVTYLKIEKSIKKFSDPTCFEIHIYPKIPKSK